MDKLPPQLKWAQFTKVLEKLGYRLYKSHPGSARTFVSDTREPAEATFHEPHGANPIRVGTLREYLRKIEVDRDEFSQFLYKTQEAEATEEEERFRRLVESSGHIVSNCTKCYGVVARSVIEADIVAAEAAHPCFQST